MMPRPVFATLLAALLAIPGAARSEPSNYDECILDAMKGVSSDVAARAIIESCRRLFPDAPEAPPAAAAASGAAAAAAASQAASATASPATASAPESAAMTESAAPASQPGPATAAAGAAAVATLPPGADAAGRSGSSPGAVRELSSDELDKLEYRGNFLGTTYRVKVYNGNEQLRLTEVTIAVWDQDDIDGLETYRSEVDIQPHDEGTAKYTVVYDGQEATWAWKLVGAKGAQ
jgi:hypothetical protein